MSVSAEVKQVRDGVAYGSIGFGAVSVLAPQVFTSVYGLKGDGNLTTMVRLWGSRNVMLGAIGLLVTDEDLQKKFNMMTLALNVTDTLAIASARNGVSGRAKFLGSVSTLGFAAAAAYAVINA